MDQPDLMVRWETLVHGVQQEQSARQGKKDKWGLPVRKVTRDL